MIANQTVIQAEAAARSNIVKANDELQAILLITSQLKRSPEYLQWLSINRWNGPQMPYAFRTGASPLFQIPQAVLQQNQTK